VTAEPWFRMPESVLEATGELGVYGLGAYAVLARRYNRERGLAWPSIAGIAATLGVNRKTVVKALGRLRAGGWIVRQGAHNSRVYRLPHLEAVAAVAAADRTPHAEGDRRRGGGDETTHAMGGSAPIATEIAAAAAGRNDPPEGGTSPHAAGGGSPPAVGYEPDLKNQTQRTPRAGAPATPPTAGPPAAHHPTHPTGPEARQGDGSGSLTRADFAAVYETLRTARARGRTTGP
jgi:biotin operon repressor